MANYKAYGNFEDSESIPTTLYKALQLRGSSLQDLPAEHLFWREMMYWRLVYILLAQNNGLPLAGT
tara:strand:+ start:340 stop:537 length:198 start_codon:yes stop_codon:yes gene_type:complete